LALPGWITLDLAEQIIQEMRTDVLIEIYDMLKQYDLQKERVLKQEQVLRQDPGQCISMDGSEGHRSISSEQSDGSLSPSVTTNTSGGHLLPNPRPDLGQRPTIGFFKRCTAFFSF
jgi:hypothetical protein